jgi:segregation and condensation protein A
LENVSFMGEPQEQESMSAVIENAGDPYKVRLDVFNGPMDLLLYLVGKAEVDIYDIPIARIVDQYMHYLEALRASDVEVTGDFIVMASTLMLIKSRLLLPTEEVDLEEEIDPRDDLIRQLLEYKKYKTLSRALEERGREHALREGRPRNLDKGADDDIPLEEVDLYDLVKAFARVLDDTGHGWGTSIVHSEKPITAYIADIVSLLQKKREFCFIDLFTDARSRDDALGLFIGLLELTRLTVVTLCQAESGGEIRISCIADEEQLNKLKSLDLESVLLTDEEDEGKPLWREAPPAGAEAAGDSGATAGEPVGPLLPAPLVHGPVPKRPGSEADDGEAEACFEA